MMKESHSKVNKLKRKSPESRTETVPRKLKKQENVPARLFDVNEDDKVKADPRGAESALDRMSAVEDDHSLSEILKMIKLPQSRNIGLKRLSEQCRKDDGKSKNSIFTYLKASPECKELFNLLENEDRPSNQEARLIWDAFEGILLTTSNAGSSLEAIGLFIVSKILSKHIKMLYSAMNSSSPSDLTKSVLKLLTSFVAQGKKGAAEVLSMFDFTLKGFEALAKKRDNKAEIDVRTCFLRFFLSFFVFGDETIIKDVLALPVLTNGVVNGLLKDSLPMIHLVVSTLTEKIVKNDGLLKKTKIAFFNTHALAQFAHLYINLKNRDNEETAELRNEIQDLILEMLNTLCMDPELGILFTNKQGILAARSNNPVLLSFLRAIQKLAITDPVLRDLTSRTLAYSPDLIIPYISNLSLNLEPRDSEPWLNNIGFIAELWTKLPSFDGLLEDFCAKKTLQQMTALSIPSVCNKVHLTNGLKHLSLIVKQKTLDLIKVCLQRAVLACSFLKSKDVSVEILEQFAESITKQLPDVRVFIACKESTAQAASKNASSEVKKTPDKKDGLAKDAHKKLKSGTKEIDVEDSILNIMLYLQQIQPGILNLADFNICKLFKSNEFESFLDSERLLNVLTIALMEPNGSLRWFSMKSDLYANALKTVFTAYIKSNSSMIKEKSRKLIKRLITETGSITENSDEIDVWLDALGQSFEIMQDATVGGFFQQICSTTSHDLYSITDEIIEMATSDSDDEETSDSETTLMTGIPSTADSIGFTPLVVAALRNFTRKIHIADEKSRSSISRFIGFVLMDILMSQENPNILARVVRKYVSIIKEVDQEKHWYLYWQELQDFACYWCKDESSPLWHECNEQAVTESDEMFFNSPASVLRKKLLVSSDIKSNSKFTSEVINPIIKFLTDIPAWYSYDAIRRCIKVVLCFLNRASQNGPAKVTCVVIRLTKEILNVFATEDSEVDKVDCTDKNHTCKAKNQRLEIFRVVVEASAMEDLFLNSKKVREAECVKEIVKFVLEHANDKSVLRSFKPYFAKLSKSVLRFIKLLRKGHGKTGQRFFSLVMDTLEIMAIYMPMVDRYKLFKILVDTLIAPGFQEISLTDSGLISVIKELVNFAQDVDLLITDDRSINASNQDPKIIDVDQDGTDDCPSSTELTSKSISSLFKLFENCPYAELSDIILSVLKFDNSNAISAPASIIDYCLRTNSETSLEILKILCHSSPAHADEVHRRIVKGGNDLTRTSMICISHVMLLTGCNEFREKSKKLIQCKFMDDLVSTLVNADGDSDLQDFEIKMVSDILTVTIEEEDVVKLTFIKTLERLSKLTSFSSKCRFNHLIQTKIAKEMDLKVNIRISFSALPFNAVRVEQKMLKYQIDFFENFCIKDQMSKHETGQAMEALIHLMQIWENTFLDKDPKEQFEQEVGSCINKLCLVLRKGTIMRLNDKTIESLAKNWTSLLPLCLKHRVGNPKAMSTIQYLVKLLYPIKRFKMQSSLTLENIYQYILSHSRFLPILLEEEYDKDTKDAVLDLLGAVAQYESITFEESHLKAFLTAYNASLSSTDQKLFLLLRMYEDNGASILSIRPFAWGKRALELRADIQDSNQTLYDQTEMKDVIESLERNMLIKTAFNFPLDMDVTEKGGEEGNVSFTRDDIYDPRFLLPLFSRFLSQDSEVDCRKFIDSGCFALVVAALSSQNIFTRKAAYHTMARFMGQLESARFREKTQVMVLLEALKNSISEEGVLIPSIITCFTLRCSQILLRPDQHLYLILNRFLLQKPFLDLRNVPLFLSMLNSADLQYNAERTWIVKLLASGLRSSTDYYIYKKNQVFEQIMSLYDSSLCDATAKKSIADVIIAAAQVHQAAFDLVKSSGLLAWLRGKMTHNSVQQTEFVIQILSKLVETFQNGLDVINDDGDKEIRKPVPQNFATECVLICLSISEQSSMHLKLEHLLSLTHVLDWCMSIKGGIVSPASCVSREQIKSLLVVVESFTKENIQNHVMIKVLECVASLTNTWLHEIVDSLSTANPLKVQRFLIWLSTWFLKQVRCVSVGSQILETVTDIIHTIPVLFVERKDSKNEGGVTLKCMMKELTKSYCMFIEPRANGDLADSYKSSSKNLANYRTEVLLLLVKMMHCLYSKSNDPNAVYRQILQNNYSSHVWSVTEDILKTCSEDAWFRNQSLLLLIMESMQCKESPESFISYIKRFRETPSIADMQT